MALPFGSPKSRNFCQAVREARVSGRLVEADGGVEGTRLRAVADRCLGNGTWQVGKG